MRNQYKLLSEKYNQVINEVLGHGPAVSSPIVELELVIAYDHRKANDIPNIWVTTNLDSNPYPDIYKRVQEENIVVKPSFSTIGRGHSVQVFGKSPELLPQMIQLAYKDSEPYAVALNCLDEVKRKLNAASKTKFRIVWQGLTNIGCKGAWADVSSTLEANLKELYSEDRDPIDKGDQSEILQKDYHGKPGRPFPMRMYFPPTYKEFIQLLRSGQMVQFFDGEWFRVYGLDKAAVTKQINEVLNSMEDWGITFDY